MPPCEFPSKTGFQVALKLEGLILVVETNGQVQRYGSSPARIFHMSTMVPFQPLFDIARTANVGSTVGIEYVNSPSFHDSINKVRHCGVGN